MATIAVDCDYHYGQRFDNLSQALVYAIELMGAVSTIHERDLLVAFQIPFLRVWPSPDDPYTWSDVGVLLDQVIEYWQDNEAGMARNITHLLPGYSDRAGLAMVDMLCNADLGYGLSAGLMSAYPRPLPEDTSGEILSMYRYWLTNWHISSVLRIPIVMSHQLTIAATRRATAGTAFTSANRAHQ